MEFKLFQDSKYKTGGYIYIYTMHQYAKEIRLNTVNLNLEHAVIILIITEYLTKQIYKSVQIITAGSNNDQCMYHTNISSRKSGVCYL